MIDISKACGLPVKLDEVNCKLILDGSLSGNRSEERRRKELQPFLYDKNAGAPEKLYTLYNDVGRAADKVFLAQHGLRYDVGVMPPLKIGKEHVKTMGHYHSLRPGTDIPYAEVYEIVHGTAHFILQKQDMKDDTIVNDIIWIEAREGDRLVMPPDYAHVTINPGPAVLVLANLAAAAGAHSYSRIVEMGGMAFFDIEDGGKQKLVKNPNYSRAPEIRTISLKRLQDFGVNPDRPIYLSATSEPQRFRFILEPQDYVELFDNITRKDKNMGGERS